jgi:dephospho-CoA kinase
MLKIGLTGGIGSGKSTVAAVFEILGIAVYYADQAAKQIMNEDDALKQEIIREFGEGSYVDGRLDRQYISSRVFNDPRKLASLNALVHPATIRNAENWMKKQSGPYAIKESALIFESGAQENLDYVIGVYAPERLRVQRVMKRDKSAEDEVIDRMRNQMDEKKKMSLCDFVIRNDEQQLVIPQVLKLHEQLSALAKDKV